MTTCRHPIIEEECGKDSASLITDALRITFASSWDLYEPPEMRQMIRGGFQSSYPEECRQLASEGVSDSGGPKNQRDTNGNEYKGNSRKIRMLVAVSTNVLTNTSLMCRFGHKIQEFFASYCPNGDIDGMDSDFMSLAITVP